MRVAESAMVVLAGLRRPGLLWAGAGAILEPLPGNVQMLLKQLINDIALQPKFHFWNIPHFNWGKYTKNG
jgi:hypothetical protein